jgi:hypothetical protein
VRILYPAAPIRLTFEEFLEIVTDLHLSEVEQPNICFPATVHCAEILRFSVKNKLSLSSLV